MEKCYFITYKTKLEKVLYNKKIERCYVGDGECDFNFIYFMKLNFYNKILFENNKKLTIVTPATFTQNNIKKFREYLIYNKEFLLSNDIEFVVNDWGTLNLLEETGLNKNMIFGFHMYFQKKDPASYNFINDVEDGKKKFVTNISIDYLRYDNYLKENNFHSLELCNFSILDSVDNISIKKSLYYPTVPFSFTKYCYNSTIYDNTGYLRPTYDCDGCKGKDGKFEFDSFGTKTIYSGNKYSYKDFSKKIIENKNIDIERIIYNFDF